MTVISDVETTGLNWWDPEFRITHYGYTRDGINAESFDPHSDNGKYQSLLNEEQVVFNAAYEGNVFPKRTKIKRDVMLYGFARQPDVRTIGGYSLENQCRYFGLPEFQPWKGSEIGWDSWQRRNMIDVLNTHWLDTHHIPEVNSRFRMFLDEVLTPANILYGDLRRRGIHINQEWRKQFALQQDEKLIQLHREAVHHGWPPSGNLRSPQQVQQFMYFILKLPKPPSMWVQGRTVELTTGDTYLAEIEHLHPFVSVLREYRTVSRNHSQFLADDSDWAPTTIHPSWSMVRIITGRPQAFKPTVLNVPRDKSFRKLICAPPGKKILHADLSQIELRIIAYLSRDETMREIYRNDGDIHRRTAQAITGKSEPTDEERTEAKPVNFLYNYGGSAEKARKQALAEYGIRWSPRQSEFFRSTYFATYSGVERFHRRVYKEVMFTGSAKSLTGMCWDLSEYSDSRMKSKQAEAHRFALNYPIQHLGAMMMLLGFLALEEIVPGSTFMTFHDAVDGYIDEWVDEKQVIREWDKLWKAKIEHYFPEFDVPVKVDYAIGQNLGELEKCR